MPFQQSTSNSNGLSFSLTFLIHTYQEVITAFAKVTDTLGRYSLIGTLGNIVDFSPLYFWITNICYKIHLICY